MTESWPDEPQAKSICGRVMLGVALHVELTTTMLRQRLAQNIGVYSWLKVKGCIQSRRSRDATRPLVEGILAVTDLMILTAI